MTGWMAGHSCPLPTQSVFTALVPAQQNQQQNKMPDDGRTKNRFTVQYFLPVPYLLTLTQRECTRCSYSSVVSKQSKSHLLGRALLIIKQRGHYMASVFFLSLLATAESLLILVEKLNPFIIGKPENCSNHYLLIRVVQQLRKRI
jgi:hypothetical protein